MLYVRGPSAEVGHAVALYNHLLKATREIAAPTRALAAREKVKETDGIGSLFGAPTAGRARRRRRAAIKNESFTLNFGEQNARGALAGSGSVGSSFRVDTGPRFWLSPLLVRPQFLYASYFTYITPTPTGGELPPRSSKTTTCLRARLKSQFVHRREALNALRVARDARDDGVGQRAHSDGSIDEGHA